MPVGIVRRPLLRVAIGGTVLALVVLVAGRLLERAQFGNTDASAVQRIAQDVGRDFTTLASELAAATGELEAVPLEAPLGGEPARARALFDRAAELLRTHPRVDAVSIADASGRPLAWGGRPSTLPDERLNGPPALFVTPGSLGLRLVHVRPIREAGANGRRMGSVAAEHLLTRDAAPRAGNEAFTFQTALLSLALRPRYEGAGESKPPYGFLIGAPGSPPLLEAEVAPEQLRALRARWRARVDALALIVLTLTVLASAVSVRTSQEQARSPGPFLRATAVLLGLLVLARVLIGAAMPPDSTFAASRGWLWQIFFGSAAEFAATALLLLLGVAVAGDLVERWRCARHANVRAPATAGASLGSWMAQVASAVAIGLLLIAHEHLLAFVLRRPNNFGAHFSLDPFVPQRLLAIAGTVLLNAAVFWAAVVLLRLASTWRVRRQALARRAAMGIIYVAVPLTVLALGRAWRVLPEGTPFVATVLAIVLVGALARQVAPRYRHASQGLRLLVAYVALVLPSLALYPVLMALEDDTIARVVARQYTPEVLNHRTQLRVLLRRALDQLDAVPGLSDQFALDTAVTATAPDADRAYFLWSQTELGRQRLTSSVELFTPEGALVSRFALNLPAEFLITDRPVDANCSWDVFGEALASTDDQVLLHAGRAICERDAAGNDHRVGVLLVHVVLDYGTLPFVAAQDPYAALFRSTPPEPAHGRDIEFAVYGWGRTPVYPTAGTAWSISSELLQRLFRADRQAFWTNLSRGDQRYRVLLSNDRAGIYAIGYGLLKPVDHGVALAEIGTFAGLLFVLLVVSFGLLSRLAGRHPVTGRALLREIRQSFYRKLFLLFVGASVVPVVALAFVTRAYFTAQLREGLEASALRTASAARRVIETVVSQQRRDRAEAGLVTDDIMVSVSRIIDQDVNVFANARLIATSQRDLYASGLLPTRTPAEVFRSITLERQASYVGDERLGLLRYTVAAVPVRDGENGAILTVPLTLRQQEVLREIDALDHRVTLAAVLFVLLGAAVGYFTAERIADPVNRLTRATGRIARGDLDARIHASTADELRRLVDAFNQMAADLKSQRAELERTNRLAAWADMARQVAHDIKNPLTPIQLSAEHLRRVHRDAGSPLGALLEGCIDTILSQVSLLRQIASEFSSFASSPVAHRAPTSLADVVEEVIAPYRTGLPDNVALAVEEGPVPEVLVDRGLLGRALVNVIENALHAMRGGGTLTVRSAAIPDGARLEVEDTGVGMDADALERLFEPYFSTKATGTGLGLTIAKRNVELNGGTIAVTSEKGRGTRVTITLLAVQAAVTAPDASAGG
jgi:signal transduction histidine kinase